MMCDSSPDSYRSCDCDVCTEADDLAEDMMTRAIAESMANKGNLATIRSWRSDVAAKRLASAFRALGFHVEPSPIGGYYAIGSIDAGRPRWQVEILP